MIKACYIHIPFCKNICSYCDFCKNYYNENIVNNYLEALKKEIINDYKNEELDTLYVGGGTPSSLSYNNLNKLFNIFSILKLAKDYEFTFECNYEDITEELLNILTKNKVNRLSIGIQSFNEGFSKILNRKINKEEMIKKIELAKQYFDNINIDLMYAISNQSLKDLKNDLEELIKLDISHVSTYALIVEEHTKLGIKSIEEVSDDIQNKMYYTICDFFNKHGYEHYELSNFAKKGYYSKHNLTYWNNENYYGFGAGASGFIGNKRYDNTKSILNYINGKRKAYEEEVDKETLIKDEVMLNLRMIKGINKKEFKIKYNLSFEDAFNYKKLILDDILEETDEYIFIPYDKLFVSNEIILMLLDTYTLNK